MKLTAWALGLVLCCGLAWAQVEPQNLLVNGGFLTNTNGWTIVSGNIYVMAGDGCRFNAPNSVLKQSFATVPGQRYRLRFMMTAVAFGMPDKKLLVQVSDKTQNYDFKLAALPAAQAYTHPAELKVLEFVAREPKTDLVFTGNTGDDHGCIISNVSVTAVTADSDRAEAIKSVYSSMSSAVSRRLPDYLNRVVAEDFVLTASDGTTQSRADFLAALLKTPGTRVAWTLKDVHTEGSDVIVHVEKTLSGTQQDDSGTHTLRIVSTTEDRWTQSHGDWVLSASKVLEEKR